MTEQDAYELWGVAAALNSIAASIERDELWDHADEALHLLAKVVEEKAGMLAEAASPPSGKHVR